MKRSSYILLFGSALVVLAGALAQSNRDQAGESSTEWPTYGHDSGGMRFSPLKQITPANVDRLKVAWVYHMKPAGALCRKPALAPLRPVLATRPKALRSAVAAGAVVRASAPVKVRRSLSMARCICPRPTRV